MGMIVAPAGCGKTHLLAESVACSIGRQLVLTHTHAGVRAIRKHLERQKVPASQYRVTTIDGFSLRYASSFPARSGWTISVPTGDDWELLRVATLRLFSLSSVRRVLAATYSGVFVDEYQDCSMAQHRLILALAEILPVRIVGDPLQAIFALLDPDAYCDWADVQAMFTTVAELNTPHRWMGRNELLGEWLIEARQKLIAGAELDLRKTPVIWKPATQPKEQTRLKACASVKNSGEQSIVALRQWRPQCHKLARSLNGRYRTMETVECDELLQWSHSIDVSNDIHRVNQVLKFSELCLSGLPTAVKRFGGQLEQGKSPKVRRDDFRKVLSALESILESDSLTCIENAMQAIASLNERPVVARHELWCEMKRTLREHRLNPSSSLQETAFKIRDRLRHVGSSGHKASLATTLLVKGLEYDHAIVLEADDHLEAETLYVALTRGSRTLTVVSDNPVLLRKKPRYLNSLDGTSTSH